MTIRDRAITFTFLVLLIFAGRYTFGQETRASLGGKVTDLQGSLVPAATVVLTADATKVVQTTTANNVGEWRIDFLLPGIYHFEVSAPGFEMSKYAAIELRIGDAKTIDTQLRVGSRCLAPNVGFPPAFENR